jgi:tetratricopeptide (TPR) repeat protein
MRCFVLLVAAMVLQAEVNQPHIRAAADAFREGQAAQATKQFEVAATFFQKAIDIEPTFMEARKDLIAVNLDAGRRLEAAKAITQFLEIEPEDTRDRVLLGQILLEQQQTERALAQFSAVLNLQPDNADALLGFAAAASKMGMQDRAREALERGRKHYPSDPRFSSLPGTKPVN